MSRRDKVFSAADELFLRKLDFDLPIAEVRALSGGRIGTVGDFLNEWKRERRATAAAMPKRARDTVLDLAERIFICGVIVSERLFGAVPVTSSPDEVRTEAEPGRSDNEPIRLNKNDEAAYFCALLGSDSEPRRRRANLPNAVWRDAAHPEFAKAVAAILRKTGHPLWATTINEKLPDGLRIEAPRRTDRDFPKRLKRSGLEIEAGRWWFVGEERPQRMRKVESARVESDLAATRAYAPILLADILTRLRTAEGPMRVRELMDWARENLDIPTTGKFDHAWLKQSLKRMSQKESRLIRAGGAYRWVDK